MFSFIFKPKVSLLLFVFVIQSEIVFSQNNLENDKSFGCTTITLGKNASSDGSVITSHTCDSHWDRSWIDIIPPKRHEPGSMKTLYNRIKDSSFVMPVHSFKAVGEIPEIDSTFGFINTVIRCVNDHQLAIGESTFGGRESLHSNIGLLQYEDITRIILERCTTARDAIKLVGELTKKYGWNDGGECFTIADPKEVWHLEIIGPGEGKVGSIWAAQRVPDGHLSVNANASRIRQIDLGNPDYFMASEDIFTVAQDSGWWDPETGPFEFCYAYDPKGRTKISCRRREWRVFDLVAPSLKLNPNSENYPFSVKPDDLVSMDKLISIFQDYYEGTEFNPIKNITWINNEGKTEISPMANPFMPYDMNRIFKINGGWGWRGERTIARWYTVYATIIQLRDWLPDEIGGVVWFAWDNVASSIYVPLYCGITDIPKSFKTPGRIVGFNRESAWWAFNRLGTLTAQRWGEMRYDVRNVWDPIQTELLKSQINFEQQALNLYRNNPGGLKEYLTKYSIKNGEEVVGKAWELGDFLWTKYDEKF